MECRFLLLFLVASVFCAHSGLSGKENKIPKLEDVPRKDGLPGDENQLDKPEDISPEDDIQGTLSDVQIKPKSVQDVPGLTEEMLGESIDEAKKETEEDEKRTPRQESQALQSHYRRFIPELEQARISAMVMERTIKRLATKLGLSENEAARTLEGVQSDHLKQLYDDKENDPGNFNSNSYRSITGRGNNVRHRNWGAARTPFRRLLRPAYADGISKPRCARNGRALPNARKVSSILFRDRNRASVKMSHMAMIWGQFLDHDITSGAQPDVDCSGTCGLSGECFGIRVPAGDTPFRSKGKTCIELKRDVPKVLNRGGLRRREQINVKSAYIDASQVYGDDPKEFRDLRETGTPFLRSSKHPQGRCFKDFLPKQIGGFCRTPNVSTMPCFKAGDERTNENPGLGSMHTIWLREHNRIATELKKINSHWSANKVFHETRKIVGAMMQHITYKEFLPLILNRRTSLEDAIPQTINNEKPMEEPSGYADPSATLEKTTESYSNSVGVQYNLKVTFMMSKLTLERLIKKYRQMELIKLPYTSHLLSKRQRFKLFLRRGFYYGYRRNIDATISNSFAAAAYRFGHSLVQNQLNRFGMYYQRINPHIPMNRFLDPSFLYQTNKGGVDSILRGLAKDRSQKVDIFFAKAVQEQLIRSPNDLADLPALNIQRGREHGVPGYNAFRRWAGLSKARYFNQLRSSIPWYRLRNLRRVYSHPDDIDLFVGGMYERPLRGAVLGRVFSYILAEQFQRLRRGDRFWYENPGVFTAAQLKEIRKVRLSKVICRNSDNIRGIQFRVLARQKRLVSCWTLHKFSMNLKRWRSSPFHG